MKRSLSFHWLVWLLPLTLLAGCGPIIGWWVNAFAPPQKVDPVYEPPTDRKVLVFVDDMLHPVSYEPIKAELTEQLNRQLIEHDLAEETVTYDELLMLMAATPEFNELAVMEVGERLGAGMTLYVEIDRFALKDVDVSPLWHPQLEVSVRLVDADGIRLWPEDRAGGYPVKPVEIRPHSHTSDGHGAELSRLLAAQMADRVAKLFYKHEVSRQEAAELEQESRQR